ncbi:Serine/threonine-protein kinase PrkC [Maioricimonas rarisocia]|uniref:Serine/threonine-protein kinase PrkC n=1 Tax=Maioricimonas rarisocia TaxID=2528026 RepID=A0A517ZDM2_9PLAN|nr:serine/threonine-protein kinase [Maioricimonas rarisocia]QDU40576.1 Serine/threonine-protein kinase PrkC [Maioricimonas rarisocia]
MKFTFAPESRPLEGYTIKRAIYRGGFGEVYYGLTDAGREVAMKLLQNNSEVELRGVQQCLNLSHPNLVTIFDIKQDGDGDHWIIMEYVAGETLDAAIRRHPDGMPMEEVRRWLPGMAAGIEFLHDRGLVHRDLKPANVFSDNGIVKVGDVGLSKFITPSRRSAQTQSVGTVYYMAPEVAKGRYGKEVDVYALGIMLYEMLTGAVPFDGESTGEILMKHLASEPDLAPLPPRIQPVIAKALAKEPGERYHSVRAFADAFNVAVVGRGEAIDIDDASVEGPRRPRVNGEKRYRARPAHGPAVHQRTHPMACDSQGGGVWPWLLLGWLVFIMFGFGRGGFVGATMGYWTLVGIGYLSWLAIQTLNSSAHAFYDGLREGNGGGHVAARPVTRRPRAVRLSRKRYRELNPDDRRPMTFRRRLAEWSTSAAFSSAIVAVLTAGVAAVSPRFFQNNLGLGHLDPAAIGLFVATALMAVWAVTGVCKLFEGMRMERGSRRLLLLLAGAGVGLAAWGTSNFLMVDAPNLPDTGSVSSNPDALFTNVGTLPLYDLNGHPTAIGYMMFFGTLFMFRRWWWHCGAFRATRFRISSLLLTVMLAYFITLIWAFPQVWGMTWAAIISSAVQLSAPWIPPEQRRIPARAA